jgi:thiol-disulfide isomerase/thioredoxin
MKIIMFSQTWCAPCKQLKPHLEAAAEQLGYDVEVIQLDKVDNAGKLITDYSIDYTPTVFFIGDGFEERLNTTDPHIQKPNALAIKSELEQYV